MSTFPDRFESFEDKCEWIKFMRQKFCIRPEFPSTRTILNSDGSLNQSYFHPPLLNFNPPSKKTWNDDCKALLIKGIQTYGIGHFRQISEQLLPDWTAQELRQKTMRLIGRQNLTLYKNWKGSEQDIAHEFQNNKQLGQSLGYWKNNMLVYDDDGLVLESLKSVKKQRK